MRTWVSKCKKLGYFSEEEAEEERAFINRKGKNKAKLNYSYRCDECRYWHHTSMPIETKRRMATIDVPLKRYGKTTFERRFKLLSQWVQYIIEIKIMNALGTKQHIEMPYIEWIRKKMAREIKRENERGF